MKQKPFGSWIDRLGLGAIALVGLGYITFSSSFAEISLRFSFLSFPIFIGEILLSFCFLLLGLKLVRREWWPKQELWALLVYGLFVLLKALWGYWNWGPLALRDAAMFYYPAFALFGYAFWTMGRWGRWERRISFAVILIILLFRNYHYFWPFSLIILALILARREEEKPVRFLFIAAVFLLAPYDGLFPIVRTVVVASVVSIVFLVITLAWAIRYHRRLTFAWLALGLMTILVFMSRVGQSGFWKRVDPSNILGGMLAPATETNLDFPSRKLYNPDGSQADTHNSLVDLYKNIFSSSGVSRDIETTSSPSSTVGRSQVVGKVGTEIGIVTGSSTAFVPAEVPKIRPLAVDFDNARFRLYIWRDMGLEYWHKKPLFGFDFGYPLRSPTMKEHGMITSQDDDGWLGAHNSLLYMMYRGGVVGLAFVGFLLVFWGRLVRDMVRLRTLGGILLCSVLLYWIVAANFFLIFELPYTAIPFWTLLGITAKYRSLLRRSRKDGSSLPKPKFWRDEAA